MKNTLSTILCVLLAVVMAAAGIGIGAVRGWNGERQAALNALSGDGDLAEALQVRAMDAANLAVVAGRHLTDDADVAALQNAYHTIVSGASADKLAQADAAISIAAANLAARLPELSSVKASTRDQVYISTLTRTLVQQTGSASTYAAAIDDYNQRLNRSLTGKLAMLLGVQPLVATGGN